MVGRESRLGGGPAFERLFRDGAVTNGPFFVLRTRRNDLRRPRWAFAVGKRVAPSAVTRNLARRRLRAAVDRVAFAEGWDIVIVARRTALAATVNDLARSLQTQLNRLAKVGEKR